MSAVSARDVFFLYRAAYGDVAALRGFSLEVEQGEVVAVLGPSGAGKTTLLRLCAGLGRPSSGALEVLGRQVESAKQPTLEQMRRESIAIVRQHYHRALPPELTAREIVALPLKLLDRWHASAAEHVDGLLECAGLHDRVDALPAELSGGEQQRVAVCAALAKQPQLILADEPTGELDAHNTTLVVKLLVELARDENCAALLVTHDPAVSAAAERTIHIRDGRISAEGRESPALILDEQGWLRLPTRVREQAGLGRRVRARASWGRVELLADEPTRRPGSTPAQAGMALEADAKRFATEASFDRVSKRYDSANVLQQVSHTFAAERLHVLAGASGSGKTTFLNLLAALELPDEGSIWVGGERIDGLSAEDAARWRQRTVGYLSQHSTLVDYLTARENVELALALRGYHEGEARERAQRSLDWVGLSDLAERRGNRLSGGEQRRVALARALAPSPRILLADEPTAHLDRVTGRIVIRLLRQAITQLGMTVVAASHDPDVVTAADERIVLDRTR